MKICTLVYIAAMMSLAAMARGQENWPQFRGINAQGHAAEARGLVSSFGDTENVTWKTPIHGRAWSSPVIWGKQVWLTTATEDGKQLFAVCLDRDTGKIIHDLKLFDIAKPQYCHPFNTYASPTPAIEEGRVYITFGSPGTACLDTSTGQVLWTRNDLVCNHYRGAASSLVIFENLLITHYDGSDHQFVLALDKNTGKTVWQTNRSVDFKDLGPDGKPKTEGDFRKAFSTPVFVTVDGRVQMISLGSMACYAYDPRTGQELWRVENRECHSGSPIPIVGDGMMLVCMGLSRGQLYGIRLGAANGVVTDSHIMWKIKANIPTRCSPVLVDGLLYLVDDGGIATCLEPRSGAEVWRQRLKGLYSASPLFADGKIYFLSEKGDITVIQAGRQYKELAAFHMSDGFMASPAVAGKALFLRTIGSVYRVEAK